MTTKRKKSSSKSNRRLPERTCVACQTQRHKDELIRLALAPDGTVVVDATGKGPGRGAYLCRDSGCWSDERLAQRLGRALKVRVCAACVATLAESAAALLEEAGDGTTGRRA